MFECLVRDNITLVPYGTFQNLAIQYYVMHQLVFLPGLVRACFTEKKWLLWPQVLSAELCWWMGVGWYMDISYLYLGDK